MRLILALLVLAACTEKPQDNVNPPVLEKTPLNHLVVATSDYQVGALKVIDLTGEGVLRKAFPIHADAIVRAPLGAGPLFVVNRLGMDSLLLVKRDLSEQTGNFRAGESSNPQDVAWLGQEEALVSRFQMGSLLKLHLPTGMTLSEIDLTKVASNPDGDPLPDTDGKPEMTWMHARKGKVWVQLQRLDNFKPTSFSQIAIVDLFLGKVDAVRLARTNPVTDFKFGPDGKVYLGEAGWMGAISKLDGAIERRNTETLAPEGIVIEESALGGDIVDFEIVSEDLGIALVATPKSRLVAFDVKRGVVTKEILKSEGFTMVQILLDRQRAKLYVADRDPNGPGVRLIDLGKLEDTGQKWDVGLPPYHLQLAE